MSCEFHPTPTACRDGWTRPCAGLTKPPTRPVSLDSRGAGADSVSGASSERANNPAFLPRASEKPAPSTLPGDAERGHVMLSALMETAMARKLKHPKGPQVPPHFSDRSPRYDPAQSCVASFVCTSADEYVKWLFFLHLFAVSAGI